MSMRQEIIDYSKGDRLRGFWRLFAWRSRTANKLLKDVQTFFLNRMAHRHGGYIGRETVFRGEPLLPHGLHGIYISRYASIGEDCCIYQNVTIGEVRRKAPQIGDHCLIGAGALVTQNMVIPDGSLAFGSPAKIRGTLTDEAIEEIRASAASYRAEAAECRADGDAQEI